MGNTAKDRGRSNLDAVAKAVSFNIALQVVLRVSSFALNGFTLRYVEAELLGVVNLRLTLLYSSILFLSREALRKAALSKTDGSTNWRHTFNLMWISVPVGVAISLALSLLWLSPVTQQPGVNWDKVGVVLYAVSAVVELFMEPLWVMAQSCQHVTIKVIAEGVSQCFRCIIVAVGVVITPQYGLLVFTAAQFLCSLTHVLIYYWYFMGVVKNKDSKLPITSVSDTFPLRSGNKQFTSPHLITLSWSFFQQSFLKQFLTDGERYVMTVTGILTFAEQGVYDVINNLGSLVARFIFLPIEENFYIFFAATLLRGVAPSHQPEGAVELAGKTLGLMLKLVFIIGLTIVCFGYPYSRLALDLYGGSLLSSGAGPLLLQCYCVYVLFLAVNGITECFMFAAMAQQEVDKHNTSMLFFSFIFLLAATLLTSWFGSVGFILANCVNMATRIAKSCRFISNFFSSSSLTPLSSAVPSYWVWLVYVAAFMITTLSEYLLCCSHGNTLRLAHVLIGSICLMGVVLTLVTTEQELFVLIIRRLPHRVSSRLSHWLPQYKPHHD